MKWSNKRVLVTGAGGFIGSHLVESLLEMDADVVAFVRYNSRNDWGAIEFLSKEQLSSITIVAGDLRDVDAVRRAMKDVDIVFHLGALIGIPYSYVNPREVVDVNIMGTLNILQAGVDLCPEKIIHTSTSEIFGTAQYVPIDEKHPVNPQSPYAASKVGADFLALSFYRSFDLPVSILRPFNTYGPRQSARAVIPTIITQALTTDVIKLGNLTSTRDLTFVKDTAKGFIKLAESNVVGQTINIGSNIEISIGDLAKKIIKLTGKDVKIISEEKRKRPPKSEVERLRIDNSNAKKAIGWEPTTSLEVGLRKTIDWISQNLDLYKIDRYVV
ncbi:MAG: SDR family NAD(P)-dependent oxidoreductase [Thermoplasmata archaeon]